MGFDCSYKVIDQACLSAILDKTFRQLVPAREIGDPYGYNCIDAGFSDCYGVSEGYEQESGLVEAYLDRTVRDALKQTDFVYCMLVTFLDVLRKKSVPVVNFYIRGADHEERILQNAVTKYLKRQIGVRILYAVSKLHFYDLKRSEFQGNHKGYRSYRGYAKTRDLRAPLYRWQAPLFWNDVMQKVNCLKTNDYQYWLKFLGTVRNDNTLTDWEDIQAFYCRMDRRLTKLNYEQPVIIYNLF